MRFLALSVLSGLLVLPAISQTNKPRPAAKPKPAATPQKKAAATKPSEKTEWEKAIALTDPTERLAALRKFSETFAKSNHLSEAILMIIKDEAAIAADKLAVGDVDAAAQLYKDAAADAPSPMPGDLFKDVLSKFPANLYFRGSRQPALEIAKTLEQKAGDNTAQLLNIAMFYLSIENGSEAKRLSEASIKIEPDSAEAYQTLGLANRVDFRLEDSAAAFAKAIELAPDSLAAKRGLAEMDRSMGKADEALALYREIVAADETNVPAQTGLILSLFDAGHRDEAESEMAKSLEQNPGNVILLAGAAYWYAVHDDGAKAVALAQKAIESNPRFIWSHIALAHGLIIQKRPVDAEKVLLAARRYGNFPTLEYEIASARLAAGLYRDAADELAKSFSVKDGVIHADLGGRVPRESKDFTELVGYERRASIFAPTAADSPERAARLTALLELKQQLDAAQPDALAAVAAVDDFVRGDDPMKVHRELYAAALLLEKNIALPKVLELAKAAPRHLEAGLKVPDAVTPVLASELYETRRLALARNEFLNTPEVPASTLSAILRGRVEDITGWAMFASNDPDGAVIHLRRAVSVLPPDSAWWRTANWRLGSALALAGKDDEALDTYIKTYRSGSPDQLRYSVIEALYKRVNGSTEGLEAKIGPDPGKLAEVAMVTGPPEPEPSAEPTPAETGEAAISSPTPEPTPAMKMPAGLPIALPSPEGSEPAAVASATPSPAEAEPETSPSIEQSESPTPTPDELQAPAAAPGENPSPEPVAPESTPTAEGSQSPTPTPDGSPGGLAFPGETPEPEPVSPEPTPTVEQPQSPTSTPDVFPVDTPAAVPASPVPSPSVERSPSSIAVLTGNGLFPPVVITIPQPSKGTPKKPAAAIPTPAPSPLGETVEAANAEALPTPASDQIAPPPTASPVVSAPAEAKTEPSQLPNGTEPVMSPSPVTTPSPEETGAAAAPTPSAEPASAAQPTPSPETKPAETDNRSSDSRPRFVEHRSDQGTPIEPCTLTVSDESILLHSGGGDQAIIVGRADDLEDLDGLTAVSNSPQNVAVRRETIEGVTARRSFRHAIRQRQTRHLPGKIRDAVRQERNSCKGQVEERLRRTCSFE